FVRLARTNSVRNPEVGERGIGRPGRPRDNEKAPAPSEAGWRGGLSDRSRRRETGYWALGSASAAFFFRLLSFLGVSSAGCSSSFFSSAGVVVVAGGLAAPGVAWGRGAVRRRIAVWLTASERPTTGVLMS